MTRDELIKYLQSLPENYKVCIYLPDTEYTYAHVSPINLEDLSIDTWHTVGKTERVIVINKDY
jgi:hypothetical protein